MPRTVALPAAAALAAYANAKYGITSDFWAIGNFISLNRGVQRLEKQDRINVFYALEKHATGAKTSGRIFLAIPPDPAQPDSQTEWTYAEAYETVLKYARWLQEVHGVQKNEIVAMDITNKPMFIWMWFAIWSLGAKPAFINTNLRSKAFIHCVRLSTTRLLIVDPQIREVLDEETRAALGPDDRGRAVDTSVIDADVEADIMSRSAYRAPDEARSGALGTSPAMLIYTSGTTGLPKAATVPWSKPLSGVLFFHKLLELGPESRFFTAMPLYHTSAAVLGVMQVLGPGCTIVVAPKFSPRLFMRQVAETRSTQMMYIGELARYLLTSPLSPYDRAHKLKVAFGNGMRPDVWQRFKDRFNIPVIIEFYGATEGPSASLVYERNGFLRGAIGRSGGIARLLSGANSVLVRHDHNTDLPFRSHKTGFCIRSGTNEVGELLNLLDADNISEKFSGYYGNDKASAGKIIRNVFKKGDAYYRTGDLQRRDSDGRWYFMDRIGDTFRWKSENVSTAEVSEALGSHPAVKEANVYGVELPNHDGRAGCAAIGLVDGKTLDEGLRRDLARQVKQRLPRYAVPLFLRQMKELEVTGTMKHQKVALRNDGVDPAKTHSDQLFWLQPGSEAYEPFGKSEWSRLVSGSAKL